MRYRLRDLYISWRIDLARWPHVFKDFVAIWTKNVSRYCFAMWCFNMTPYRIKKYEWLVTFCTLSLFIFVVTNLSYSAHSCFNFFKIWLLFLPWIPCPWVYPMLRINYYWVCLYYILPYLRCYCVMSIWISFSPNVYFKVAHVWKIHLGSMGVQLVLLYRPGVFPMWWVIPSTVLKPLLQCTPSHSFFAKKSHAFTLSICISKRIVGLGSSGICRFGGSWYCSPRAICHPSFGIREL